MFGRSSKKINSSRSVSKAVRAVYILKISIFTQLLHVQQKDMNGLNELFGRNRKGVKCNKTLELLCDV